MINNFVVKAQLKSNQLQIFLDGIFMKSEIELTLYLIKTEIQKLSPGFKVLIDINNLDAGNLILEYKFNRYRKILRLMGASSVRFVGLSPLHKQNTLQNGGDYSYENEWFFR